VRLLSCDNTDGRCGWRACRATTERPPPHRAQLSELNVFQPDRHGSWANFELKRYFGDLCVVVYVNSAEGFQKCFRHEKLGSERVRLDLLTVRAFAGFLVPLQDSGINVHIL